MLISRKMLILKNVRNLFLIKNGKIKIIINP